MDKNILIHTIEKDLSLNPVEKQHLIDKLHKDDKFFDELMHGAIGASTGYIFSKFIGLSPQAQILLSMAGFGFGKYLLDKSKKHDKLVKYDEDKKHYELKD